MEKGAPSQTAFAVARLRASHQVLDEGRIFSDPFACAIVGEEPAKLAASLNDDPKSAGARAYMATRSRIGEDWLQAAYERGVRQVVVLGAGFDTFGLRNAHHDLKVFEVDHPATQRWKQDKLAALNLPIPQTLRFVPVDFTGDDLLAALASAGFHADAATFFLWLGVVPYLTEEAIFRTLSSIVQVHGAEVVFDYSEPLENFMPEQRPYIEKMAQQVASLGEPWLSYFDPPTLATQLRKLGFHDIEDLDRNATINWVSGVKTAKIVGPHLIRARREISS